MAHSCPYTICNIDDSTLHIEFRQIVVADAFFAYCADLQKCFEAATYCEKSFTKVYIDFSQTTWFDTLAMCYLVMFAEQAKQFHSTDIHFFFPDPIPQQNKFTIFHSFLLDNGFLSQMKTIGTFHNLETVVEIQYSDIHKCVWPLQIFHCRSEIQNSVLLIGKHLRNELSHELNSYELEYTINKVTYFLQETLDNAYKHGYEDSANRNPCALLIKRVQSNETLDLKSYRAQYTEHTPYINISLFEEKHEYLEIYIADIGVGLRNSFLLDPDGEDAKITDENILDYILSKGQRSNRKISPNNSSRYGGLYDITHMFQDDGDKLGFKGDSRWFFDKDIKRINANIHQHEYTGLVHGFAVVGSISWRKRHSGDYSLKQEILNVLKEHQGTLYTKKNPWMQIGYCNNITVRDYRFSSPKISDGTSPIYILFPSKFFTKDKIIDLLSNCSSKTIIIASIHESEYKKYKTTLENLNLDTVKSAFERAIIITNTLFPYAFTRQADRMKYSEPLTAEFIKAPVKLPISHSYISFRLWKQVYDSEQLWCCLSAQNFMGYINAPVKWNEHTLRGYLDFSQLCLIPDCRNLCIEQLMGFQLYQDHLYFHSLDRFTDEICEQVNHLMDNSRDDEEYWIGSVFVSGTSERKLGREARNEENVFYFFKHADRQTSSDDVCSIFMWATQAFRIDAWFDPNHYAEKRYSRVGNSSFVAEGGSNYWAFRHYMNWNSVYCLQQEMTYQLLQKQFGAHPAILKMGHFDSVDHHDLFEVKADSLIETDVIASQIIQDRTNTSYDFLIMAFLRALITSPNADELATYLDPSTPTHSLTLLKKKLEKDIVHNTFKTKRRGLIVYLNDYQTSKIIETIKPMFSCELQQLIVPIIPIEKNYTSSTLLISPLLLDALECKMCEIKQFNLEHYKEDTVNVTLFIAMSFTTRLQEELKHIMLRMGASQVSMLSLFDRQRMPYGNCLIENRAAYARLDLPAIGYPNTCPICEALDFLQNLKKSLRDPSLIERVDNICTRWKAVKSSDNHHRNGISIRHINLPEDIKELLNEYCNIYKQGTIDIYTDLGLSLFAIENTVISLSLDFLNACIASSGLEPSVKLLLLSAHVLTFNHLQLSEKHFCRLVDTLCDFLGSQVNTSIYTELAVVALCGQNSIFQQYTQGQMIYRYKSGCSPKNNDGLLAQLAIYQNLRSQYMLEIPSTYRQDLHCYLVNERNALELIYDLFLYSEVDYKQSHRQAFGQIKGTTKIMSSEIYKQALEYTRKLMGIYGDDRLKSCFHNIDYYLENKAIVDQNLKALEASLHAVKDDETHCVARDALTNTLNIVQKINNGLYLRAQRTVNSEKIASWLSYCQRIAQQRFQEEGDVILQIINGYTGEASHHSDVFPWFFAHADVTEEVINLIVDMMQRRSGKLRNFLQNESASCEKVYDGIITVSFCKEHVELSFYNATTNSKSIEEIRSIKHSKSNRPSLITFRQFEQILANSANGNKPTCFEWNYIESQHPAYLASTEIQDEHEHLFCATMKIPYVDMGSSFGLS